MRDIVERIRLRERARDERLHETIMAKAISQLYLSLPAPTFILLGLPGIVWVNKERRY